MRPFLENVTRGRGVPPERLDAVEEHYQHFGGVSPLNARNRELIAAIRARVDLPVYFGNRNWHPMVEDTVAEMARDGVRHALVFATSAYGGFSACRQYHEDIARARKAVGEGAPELVRLRHFFDHPLFVAANADAVRAAFAAGRAGGAAGVHRAFGAERGGRGGRAARGGRAPVLAAGRRGGAARRGRRSGWTSTTWCGSRGPGRRRCRGWPRTSSTTSTRCTRRARRRWSSRRWGSCPTTSRWCGTWTPRPASGPPSWAWASPGRPRPGPDPRFADMVVELVAEHTADAPPRRLSTIPSAGCTLNGAPCAPDCCATRPRP